jgi:hypothetical protein
MCKFLLSFSVLIAVSLSSLAQTDTTGGGNSGGGLGGLISGVTGIGSKGLSTDDISSGLKEALSKGATNAAKQLGSVDGYFGNAAVKILMPPEAQKIEKKLREFGMGKQVDEAILSMNRAAENAAQSAAPIFIDAIKGMSITDAANILQGSDTAATVYLKGKTTPQLTTAFKPVIKTSLDKVDATSKWATIVNYYNDIPFVKKLNPDLTAYVTDRALYGIFLMVAQEERKIRKDPLAQTTDLLRKVFGN